MLPDHASDEGLQKMGLHRAERGVCFSCHYNLVEKLLLIRVIRDRNGGTDLVQSAFEQADPEKKGMKSPIPKTVSCPMFLNLQPIAMRDSPLRQTKKRIRLTRARSRRIIERSRSTKLNETQAVFFNGEKNS